jgi:glycosyltransferase involved in cell wall biosynthesis
VIKARADQREMVKHFTHPDEYKRWYEDEPKESSLTDDHIDQVGEWFGRVGGLLAGLQDQEATLGRKPVLLDLGCNDWWMGEFFARQGIRCDGVELNKRSYDLALERIERFDRDVTVVQGDLHNAVELLGKEFDPDPIFQKDVALHRYDAVSLFEVFEHVPDIEATLDVMESLLAPGGRIYVSTPNGAFEQGNIQNWSEVQRKGHLRAIPLHELAQIILRRGEIDQLEETNGDRVGFVAYTPKAKKGTVTFYAGQSWEPWSATSLKDGGIGGSETALVQVATRMASDGWLVKVYSGAEPGLLGGVLYRPFSAWDPTEQVDLLVVSRMPHVFDNPVGAKQTALWCHDHSYDTLTPARAEKIDHIVVLSEWQYDRFARLYPWAEDRLTIIRNGISLRDWFGTDNYPMASRAFKARKPRLVYSSSADRGLDVLLDLWPRIREQVPKAELHAFYGFETLDRVAQVNPQLAAYKAALLSKVQELGGEDGGIFLRGRVGQAVLADEMQQARVLAYPTAFLETSCITAMEARAAGLAIVTSDLGALTETVGEHGHLIAWPGEETFAVNRDVGYQDEFVAAVVARLTQANLWEIWHRAALKGRDELDWSERIPQWEALAEAKVAHEIAA